MAPEHELTTRGGGGTLSPPAQRRGRPCRVAPRHGLLDDLDRVRVGVRVRVRVRVGVRTAKGLCVPKTCDSGSGRGVGRGLDLGVELGFGLGLVAS